MNLLKKKNKNHISQFLDDLSFRAMIKFWLENNPASYLEQDPSTQILMICFFISTLLEIVASCFITMRRTACRMHIAVHLKSSRMLMRLIKQENGFTTFCLRIWVSPYLKADEIWQCSVWRLKWGISVVSDWNNSETKTFLYLPINRLLCSPFL